MASHNVEISTLQDEKIRPYLDACDNIRDQLHDYSLIDLPAIVVVGDQSSGKSSLIESISGIQLPRGDSITTRCPLVIKMRRLKKETDQEYSLVRAHFNNLLYAERLFDLSSISECVQQVTKIIAGEKRSIVSTPISLDIYKHDSPDLTLIDLPGIPKISKNPKDEHTKELASQVKDMIRKYITQPEAIILCVIAADTDLPSSQAIALAKSDDVDPHGLRTIGVLTKIDKSKPKIKDKILAATTEPLNLKLGLIPVRNRTSQEVAENVSFQLSRQRELEFFKTHDELSQLDSDDVGISALCRRLISIQASSVKRTLPLVMNEINDHLISKRKELEQLPRDCMSKEDAQIKLTYGTMRLQSLIQALIHGDRIDSSLGVSDSNRFLNLHAFMMKEISEHCDRFEKRISCFYTKDYLDRCLQEISLNEQIYLPNFLTPAILSKFIQNEIRNLRKENSILKNLVKCFTSQFLEVVCTVFKDYEFIIMKLDKIVSDKFRELASKVKGRFDEVFDQEEDVFIYGDDYLNLLSELERSFHIGDEVSIYTDDVHSVDDSSVDIANPQKFSLRNIINTSNVEMTSEALSALSKVKCSSTQRRSLKKLIVSLICCSRLIFHRILHQQILAIRYFFWVHLKGPFLQNIFLELLKQNDDLLELFRLPLELTSKRTRLQTIIGQLQKASEVFDNLPHSDILSPIM